MCYSYHCNSNVKMFNTCFIAASLFIRVCVIILKAFNHFSCIQGNHGHGLPDPSYSTLSGLGNDCNYDGGTTRHAGGQNSSGFHLRCVYKKKTNMHPPGVHTTGLCAVIYRHFFKRKYLHTRGREKICSIRSIMVII